MSDPEKPPESTEPQKRSLKERLLSVREWDKKTWTYVILFLAIMALTVVLAVLWLKNQNIFYEWIIRYFVLPIGGIGFWGYIIFLVFMALQSLLMPIPSEVVLLAAGAIWGFWGGFMMGMIGSMLSAVLCYVIAARGGGPIVEKFLGKENIETVDVYLQKYGAPVVFVMRAVPFVGFDPVSYVSGLIRLDFKKYFFANLFGCISRCIFYAWLGFTLTGGVDYIGNLSEEELEAVIASGGAEFNKIILIILGVLLASAVAYNWILVPYLKKHRAQELASLGETDRQELEEKGLLEEVEDFDESPPDETTFNDQGT